MNKRILSFVAGVALVIGFSACEKEVAEDVAGVKGLAKNVDVERIKGEGCVLDFNDAGYNQAWFNSFGKQLNGSGTHKVADGINFVKKGNETNLVIEEGAKGIVTVAYKNGNYFAFMNFDVECLLVNDPTGISVFFDGKIYSNIRWEYDAGEVEQPRIVHLGFIGYYPNPGGTDGVASSTSIFWLELKEGDCIDKEAWAAVDAAYAEWIAKGGFAPARETGWQTSGYASFIFDDYAKICNVDFTLGQLENYYFAYYVDPGYIAPYVCTCATCKLDCDCACDGVCTKDGECDCVCECAVTPPPPAANKGCQNCQGNNPNRMCDGRGCDGTGRGPNGGGNQQ